MNEVQKMEKQSLWRMFGGVTLAILFVVVLILHIKTEKFHLDDVALILLVCVVGSIVFALSHQLGIAKITAGPLGVEIEPLVKQAVAELPSEQTEEVWRVLKKHSSFFPVTGAANCCTKRGR